MTITNCWVTGYYELGSVLDGTFKKFAPEVRVPRTGRIKCGTESNGGFINIAISNCVFEGCQGYALESEDGALWKTSPSPIPPCATWLRARSSCGLAPGCAVPKRARRSARMKRILISNLVCYNAGMKVELHR